MKKQKSLNKCHDRYVLIEKQSGNYTSRGKVFNQTIVISSQNSTIEDVKKMNEEVISYAKSCNDTSHVAVPVAFIDWLTTYLENINGKIKISISGNLITV